MKHLYALLLLLAGTMSASTLHGQARWLQVDARQAPVNPLIHATKYLAFTTNETVLKSELFSLPATGRVITLPVPDGSTKDFMVRETSVMPEKLAAKYPGLKTFTGVSLNDPTITAKLDFTEFGFHAMIYDGAKTAFIDPYDNSKSGYYIVHYKRDEIRSWSEPTKCQTPQSEPVNRGKTTNVPAQKSSLRTTNGYQLRTYRLALSCDHYYAYAVTGSANPTIAQVLSKMITSLNRVNGVYEREISVTMNLVDNEDTLIFTVASGGPNGNDPYSAIDNVAWECLDTNQVVCDARIGDANYDIGHVFTTGAGGLSQVGVACISGSKALSVTGQPVPVGDGFDIDYVSHEMGHEYGAYHPFNSNAGNCGGDNLYPPDAYEPGSGSTIMAYAGICAPDDLQPHSDPYFHSRSLEEIEAYISDTLTGDVCAVKAPTNNKLVAVPSFSALYNIPYLTPFELTLPGAAVDSTEDTSITYCWEERDLGSPGEELINTHQFGPIFRSYLPVKSLTRVFPKDTMVLEGILSNAGIEGDEGEKAPDTPRALIFRLTVRDIYNGYGCFVIPDDSILLNVVSTGTGSGFAVTSQDNAGATYLGNTKQTVTWNVAGTNAGAVNTPNVDIYMSDDGGYTWDYHLGTFPNTGSANITFPDPPADIVAARLKVKGTGNVFFNVNEYNFALNHSYTVNLYPVPAQNSITISIINSQSLQQFAIYNAMGKLMYRDQVLDIYQIPVSSWPRGLYFVRCVDNQNHQTIKKFVLD